MTYAGILFVRSYPVNARIGLQLRDFQKNKQGRFTGLEVSKKEDIL